MGNERIGIGVAAAILAIAVAAVAMAPRVASADEGTGTVGDPGGVEATGEASAVQPEDDFVPDPESLALVKQAGKLSRTGLGFAIAHFTLFALTGALAATGEAALGLGAAGTLLCVIDTPLLIAAQADALHARGLPVDALTWATMAMYFISVSFVPIHVFVGLESGQYIAMGVIGGALYLTTRIMSLVVGSRAFKYAKQVEAATKHEEKKASASLVPLVGAVEGGAVVGLGGTF